MKFYVAASATRQAEAQDIADALVKRGAVVTSRWLSVLGVGYPGGQVHPGHITGSQHDLEDVIRSDALVVLTGDFGTKGGRHSEVGVALAFGKTVYLLGPTEQVFHCHPNVVCVAGVDDIPLDGPRNGDYHAFIHRAVCDLNRGAVRVSSA
jgi:hypothetical protein